MKTIISKIIPLLFLLWPIGYAMAMDSIVEVDYMDQIPFQSFSSKDCVAFDLDDTVFVQKEKIMRNANFEARKQFIEGIRQLAGNERVTFVYDNSQYQLVEDSLKSEIEELNRRGVTNFGFTARRTGKATEDQKSFVEDDTLQIISQLGIIFGSSFFQNMKINGMSPNNQEYNAYIVDSRLRPFDIPHDAMVKDTVIFTNNLDKGLVLGEIFEQSAFFPDTFVLVDDKKANLLSVEEAIKKINIKFGKEIKFKGYFYTRASNMDNLLNSDVVNLQKSELLKENPHFLSDQQALEQLSL